MVNHRKLKIQAANEYYPFMYEVPPVISIIMENETLRKNFSYGNPYFDLKKQIIGDTAYWKSKMIFWKLYI